MNPISFLTPQERLCVVDSLRRIVAYRKGIRSEGVGQVTIPMPPQPPPPSGDVQAREVRKEHSSQELRDRGIYFITTCLSRDPHAHIIGYHRGDLVEPPQDFGCLCERFSIKLWEQSPPLEGAFALFCQGVRDRGHTWRTLRCTFQETLSQKLSDPAKPFSGDMGRVLTELFRETHPLIRQCIEQDSSYGEEGRFSQVFSWGSATVMVKLGGDIWIADAGINRVLLCTPPPPGASSYTCTPMTPPKEGASLHTGLGGIPPLSPSPSISTFKIDPQHRTGGFLWFGTPSFWREVPDPNRSITAYFAYFNYYRQVDGLTPLPDSSLPEGAFRRQKRQTATGTMLRPKAFLPWIFGEMEKARGPSLCQERPMSAIISFMGDT